MKLFLFFVIAFTSFIFENQAQKTVECKTGNVTIAKKDELAKVFLSEYGSKSNFGTYLYLSEYFC